MSSPGAVQVWQAGTGSWRWRYVEPPPGQPDAGEAAGLPSHKDYPTHDAAVSAARTAYPDVPVHVDDAAPSALPLPVRPGGCRRTVIRLATVVLVVAAAVARQRRAGRGRRRPVSS